MPLSGDHKLHQRIKELEKENAILRRNFSEPPTGDTVSVPAAMRPLFDVAQQTVNEYFRNLKMDPTRGTIEINDQRYVLVRASALSKDFLETIQSLYADRGESEAMSIGKNFLFDIAHVIGMNDARNFHLKMNLTDPISKLSAGTVHFAYSGWAFVDILAESNPSPNEDFFLTYDHPYSFEADSWKRAGKKAGTPICIMNAGYSSGWCEESFGISLTAVEVSCTARGDAHCRFIMSPPHKIQEHLDRFHASSHAFKKTEHYEIPTFFDRKRVEEEMEKSKTLAEESAKSKSDFVANISHELRTPLGAIVGFTDLLKKTALTLEQKDYLEAINSSGNNLLSIINDILDLSKRDAGKFMVENRPFSIRELLHSVQVMFAGKAKEKGLEFECTIDNDINYLVEGDAMRLTQVLVNIIGNAIKFTGKGGVFVTVALQSEDAHSVVISFTVKDTGIGIAPANREKIFERFTQADTNITREYGGTGLGLAICRQLVEMQGGNINFNSEKKIGTAFIFSIPYKKSMNNSHATLSRNHLNKVTPSAIKKILVVEDNLMNQKLAEVILQSHDFETVVAGNGHTAIEILRQHAFDLILMDIQMPVMDGYEATSVIRKELHISTPIIAMTAHAFAGEKERCIQAGMNDYISKPYKEAELIARIMQYEPAAMQLAPVKPAGKIIDLAFLKEQSRNNEPFIAEMISIFIEQHPKDLAALAHAVQQENYAAIYKAAHSIRNSLPFFGIDKFIGNKMLQIEQLARSAEEIETIKSLLESVRPVSKTALQELSELNNVFPG